MPKLKNCIICFGAYPFFYLTPYYTTKRWKEASKIWIKNSEVIFERNEEVLSHMQLIKALGKEKREIKYYIKNLIKNIRYSLQNFRWGVISFFSQSLASRTILGLIILYGGYQVIKGNLTLGSLTAITIYLNQLSELQNSIGQFFQQASLSFISCERLETILNAHYEPLEGESAKEVIFSKGRIEFKNATFGYRPDCPVLKNLSFCIADASCVALVGPSGCGKTTIVNLVLRLYKLDKGEISIDGYNIQDIKSKSFYPQIGVALQEPFLWNDTIENNIRYARETVDFKEVQEAARMACIDDFISSLPKGYDTVIGENACRISEGQKQRLAIARALIKKPKILILDEALSSVDAQIEAKIIENIKILLNSSTIIVISHRLSTIRKMDLVYFFTGIDEIGVGPHEELLEKSFRYQDYLAHQLKEDKMALL